MDLKDVGLHCPGSRGPGGNVVPGGKHVILEARVLFAFPALSSEPPRFLEKRLCVNCGIFDLFIIEGE